MFVCLVFFRYDSRVKAMEVDERPTEQYSDIGGLDKQIQEVSQEFCSTFYIVEESELSVHAFSDVSCTKSLILTFQLIEAVVLPMTHKERFETLGIQPPKGKEIHREFLTSFKTYQI